MAWTEAYKALIEEIEVANWMVARDRSATFHATAACGTLSLEPSLDDI